MLETFYLKTMVWQALVLLIVFRGLLLGDTQKARDFPLCVTDELFTEYAANLPEGIRFKKFISESATRDVKHIQSSCAKCGVGNVQKVWWGRIKTNFPPKEYAIILYLRQWIHIHILTGVKVQGVIVQAVTNPLGMAYGNFDLEFGCKDCGEDINLSDALQGDALGLRDKAAALPCRRRTHLHVRHPYVYAYASSMNPRSSFHMNYNYVNIPCRETLMIQLMIMTVPDFKQNSADYVFSGTIDHYTDSQDGMPYPYHVSMHSQLTCHEEDFAFGLVPPSNGISYSIPYNEAYDSCTTANESVFNSAYKEKIYHFSRYVCKNPPPTRCEVFDKLTSPTVDDRNARSIGLLQYPPGCTQCTLKKNYFTVKAFYRLVPKIYATRRIHGLCMIFGMVVAPGVSFHIARYLKETPGDAFLVGWWLWIHLFLTIASKMSVWIGLALSSTVPLRTEGFGPELDTIYVSRPGIIEWHGFIGIFALIAFHVGCLVGPFRSKTSSRTVVMFLHSLTGYVSMVLGMVSVIFSTTCYDNYFFVLLLAAIQLVVWIFAMALQLIMDRKRRIIPARKLLPVIEAVSVQLKPPKIIVRLIILIVLVLSHIAIFVLMVLSSTYYGFVRSSPCANCKWKYDEFILGQSINSSAPMHSIYNCSLSHDVWINL